MTFPIRRTPVRLAIAACLLAPAAPLSAAAPAGAPCDLVDFSSSFATDGTALCAHQEMDGKVARKIEIWATTDGGRSWRRQAATGLPQSFVQDKRGPALVDVEFSPQYAVDKLVHVALSGNGLYSTDDLGASFHLLAPMLSIPRPPSPDVLTPVGAGFLYVDGRSKQYVAPPAAVPVAGAEGVNVTFLVPPDWPHAHPVVLHAVNSGAESGGARLSQCDATFTCATTLHSFGEREIPLQLWYGGDHSTLYLAVVTVGDRGYTYALRRSTDGGRSFSRWAAADNLLGGLRSLAFAPTLPVVSLAVDPARPATIDLRVSYGLSRPMVSMPGLSSSFNPPSPPFPPGEQVFRTTDGGVHWTRTAFGLALDQKGKRGTLPWTGYSGYSTNPLWNAGGKLFTIAALDGRTRTEYAGIWCSVDGGKKWARTCAK